jgi:hypothetical protein
LLVQADLPKPAARDEPEPHYRFLEAVIGQPALSKWGKDIFSIRLSRKVSDVVLKDIVREIIDNKPPNPRTGTRNVRTIIFCYLPEVDAFVDARGPDGPFGAPWAVADFGDPSAIPGEGIRINGYTISEEIKLLGEHIPPAGEIVGEWLEDSIGRTIFSIYRRGGAFYLNGGGYREERLVARGPQPFRLFAKQERSKHGEFYRINGRGDFEVHDDDGFVLVARRVAVDRGPALVPKPKPRDIRDLESAPNTPVDRFAQAADSILRGERQGMSSPPQGSAEDPIDPPGDDLAEPSPDDTKPIERKGNLRRQRARAAANAPANPAAGPRKKRPMR